MNIPVRTPVLFIGISYFFILLSPFGWNMFIHLLPFYFFFIVSVLIAKDYKIRIGKLCYPFLLYTTYTLFSMLLIANLTGTAGKVIRCIYELSVLIVFLSYDFRKCDLDFIFKCSALSCIFVGIKMLIQGSTLSNDASRHVIVNFGKEMDPNYLAAAFIFPIMILFFDILEEKQRKFLKIAVLCILLLTVVFTGSRGTIFSILIGCMIIFHWKKRISLKHVFAGIAIVSLVFIAYQFLPDYFVERYSVEGISNDNGSNYLRLNLWSACFEIFLSNPVFGRGGDSMLNFGMQYGAFRNFMAHSTYLDTLADYGLIGGGLFFGFLFRIVKLSFNGEQSAAFAIMIATLLCAVFISAEHSSFLWQNILACIAMLKISKRNKNVSTIQKVVV